MARAAATLSPPAPRADARAAGAAFRRELWGWSALAVGALGVAGVGLVLALSRIPGIERLLTLPVGLFEKALVVHVVFSFVVWFLAVFGALLLLATHRAAGGAPRFAWLGTAAVAGMAIAALLLFAPTLLDRGRPTLNNYVPVIIDPLYYAGLAVMAAAMTLPVVRLVLNLRRNAAAAADPLPLAMAAGGLIYGVALVCFMLAWAPLSGEAPSHAFNEDLFWGGGHVLQFLNTLLLVVAWSLLAGHAFGEAVPHRAIVLAAAALLAVAVLPAPFLYVVFEPFSAAQTVTFTNLQYALAPPTVLVAAAIAMRRNGPLPWRQPAFVCLALSVTVFAIGGVLGLFVDGADTRTPAHYHGVIAGVTVAFMGLFYTEFLPRLQRPLGRGKALFVQVYLFAGGQLAACIGLFLAGGYGAPRKTAGADQSLEAMGAIVGMALNGIGALFAGVGGILFIWIVATALLRPARAGGSIDDRRARP
ncbi:MAG: cbb3-type cytochrome c oxidase subunit I [Rhodospirillales bacterium]